LFNGILASGPAKLLFFSQVSDHLQLFEDPPPKPTEKTKGKEKKKKKSSKELYTKMVRESVHEWMDG
jgi:hypothetical protein